VVTSDEKKVKLDSQKVREGLKINAGLSIQGQNRRSGRKKKA